MSRHLAIDWDHRSLRIVAATFRAGSVRLEKAVSWQEPQSPTIAEAEACGQRLRERLKSAGIAPAPVLACVARDRVILREVRYPAVAAGEEPAIVRFQVMKELSDSPDEVVIDYTPLGEAAPGEERRALVLTIRRELLAAYQMMCKAAGLKLDALTPRPFGALACLRESRKKWQASGAFAEPPAGNSSQAAVALLTSADGWSEFCLVRDDTVLVARSLPAGPALPAEVRRNIAVYTAQSPSHSVSALYLAGNGETAALQESLQQVLSIPVRTFDPFLDAEEAALPRQDRGAFAGAVGLLRAQAGAQPLPINFVSPKKPQAARDPNKRWLAIAAGLAACLLIGVVSYCYSQLAALDSAIAIKEADKRRLDEQNLLVDQEDKRLQALQDWLRGDIPWLDEFYDLTVLMPEQSKMLLSKLIGDATGVTREKPSAKLTVEVGTQSDGEIANLLDRMRKDKLHYVPKPQMPQHQRDIPSFPLQFTADIEVAPQPPEKYQRRLPPETVVRMAQRDRLHWTPRTQERPYQRPPSPPGLKKLAQWEHGSHVVEGPSATRSFTPARAQPRSYPGYNPAVPYTPPVNPANRFQEMLQRAAEQKATMQAAPVELAPATQEKPRQPTLQPPPTATPEAPVSKKGRKS